MDYGILCLFLHVHSSFCFLLKIISFWLLHEIKIHDLGYMGCGGVSWELEGWGKRAALRICITFTRGFRDTSFLEAFFFIFFPFILFLSLVTWLFFFKFASISYGLWVSFPHKYTLVRLIVCNGQYFLCHVYLLPLHYSYLYWFRNRS